MSFSALTHPDRPEAQTIEHQFGVLVGWYPAIVTSVEDNDTDPEGLGRIRLRCDLISTMADMPNEFDGWAWVLEDFVNNGKPGGSHRFIQPGAQVALSFMRGDPRFALMLGCLHSREDRPNPIFNRAKGVHGTATPNGVYSIKDDPKSSRTDAYPNGVTQQVSTQGDVIAQTRDGARTHLQADGTSRIENNQASTTIAADGTVVSRSAGNAVSTLNKDGTAQIKTPFNSALQLLDTTSRMLGIAAPLSSLLGKAKGGLGGFLGKAKSLLGTAAKVAIATQTGGGLDSVLAAQGLLSQIGIGLGPNLTQGLNALQAMQNLPIEHFQQALLPQIEATLSSNLHTLIPQIQQTLQTVAVNDLPTALSKILPEVDIPSLMPQIQGLRYSVDAQTQLLAGASIPGGFGAIENLAVSGLWDKLGTIQEIILSAPPENKLNNQKLSFTVTQIGDIAAPEQANSEEVQRLIWLQTRATEIHNTLPDRFKDLLSNEEIQEFLVEIDAGTKELTTLFQELLTRAMHSDLSQTIADVSALVPKSDIVPAALHVADVILTQGDVGQAIQSVLPILAKHIPGIEAIDVSNPTAFFGKLAQQITQQLEQPISQAIQSFNKMSELVPAGLPGAIVEADSNRAELRSLHGTHRVFADDGGAGVKTPHGGFSLGSGGGVFQALGQMAFQTLGQTPVGMVLSGVNGIQLQTYADAAGKEVAAQLQAIGNTISLTSANGNGVSVQPYGTAIDGIPVTDLIRRIADLEALVVSLQEQISALTPPAP